MGTPDENPETRPETAASPAGTATGTAAPAAGRSGGLCATCAKRESCPKRETEGGVWRCGEYEE